MNLRSTALGITSSAGVLVILAAARFLVSGVQPPEVLELREVEIAMLEEPPPPPPPPPEVPPPTPPPPALTALADVPDPTLIPLPEVDVPQRFDLPVDPFFVDRPPSPLPTPVQKPVVQRPPAPRPAPPAPVAKSHYQVDELDGSPRLLHHPDVAFPSSLAAQGVKAGTVMLEVELSEAGRVTVRRVLSSTYPELVSPARFVAQGSRFTPPKRSGQAVKAIMRWPITITQ